MKIELSEAQAFHLAEYFARAILARVHAQHLGLTVEEDNEHLFPWPLPNDPQSQFGRMQAAIRSIESQFERRLFINSVGYHFKKLRQESGTTVRGREYVRKVMEHRARVGKGNY